MNLFILMLGYFFEPTFPAKHWWLKLQLLKNIRVGIIFLICLPSPFYLSPMDLKRPEFLLSFFILIISLNLAAQKDTSRIDPSKPTNLYNRLSNSAEYNFLSNGKRTYGYRANWVWASARQHHSAQLEIPMLYATSSKKFGLSDLRFRYYWIPYRDYTKKPGAFGVVLDSYLPTGSYSQGLGRGRWIVATGLSTALVFGRFSTFPIFYYLYSGEIMDHKVSVAGRQTLNGYMLQSIFVYKFNKKSYADCTPTLMKNSYSNGGKDDLVLEGNYLYMIKPNKMQIGCFFRRYFYGDATTLRASTRIYF